MFALPYIRGQALYAVCAFSGWTLFVGPFTLILMKSLGVQLYSLRDEFAVDPEAALRRVPELVFRWWSLPEPMAGPSPSGTSLLSENRSLGGFGTRVGGDALEGDLEATAAFYRGIGCPHADCSLAPLGGLCDRGPGGHGGAGLSTLANGCRLWVFFFCLPQTTRMKLFPCRRERSLWRALARHLGDQRVTFQLDTYWVEKAGQSTLEILDLLEPHISHIHAKELRKSDGADVPAGQGDVPFPEVLRRARAHNWPVVVEFEGRDAMDAPWPKAHATWAASEMKRAVPTR